MARRGVRPTALQPFWDKAGFALGAVTALIGPEAAMACTAAVETEIDDHYSRQLDRLQETGEDPELAAMIEEFREDEREHRDAALAAVRNVRLPTRCCRASSGSAAALRSVFPNVSDGNRDPRFRAS